jgi:hypothetical protein
LYEKNYLSERLLQLEHDINMSQIAENNTNKLYNNISKIQTLQNNTRDYIQENHIPVYELNYTALKNGDICNYNNWKMDLNRPECKIINNILVNYRLSSIIQPLSSISQDSLKSLNLSDFIDELVNLSESLNSTLSQNLEKIQFYEDKKELFQELFDEINTTLKTDIITMLSPTLLDNILTLTERINQTETLDIQVKNRVSQVSTPIGQLPITIQEAISIFPLSLGIGALISTSLLLECLKLRDKIRNFFNKQGLSDKDIASIASPWIDKIESKKNRKIKFLILIIPFVIFIISSILIVYEWIVLDKLNETADIIWTFPGGKYINYYIFSISYIISLVFFIYGYKKLIVYL